MTDKDNLNISLAEAATRFLTRLSPGEKGASQQEVNRFVRWFGAERPLSGLTAPEISNYAERLSLSDTDYARKLDLTRAFLAYAKKEGWSKTSLAVHLKTKKKPGVPSGKPGVPETIPLTPEGNARLKNELAALKDERREVIDEMRRAAADKDFRENAPLHAARERRGHLEGRIKELEETLKMATVVTAEQRSGVKANIGDKVILYDLASGEEICYIIVNPKEVDPTRGKISSVSPIGKAIVGQSEGDNVEVTAPAGKLRYRVKRVER